jgi:hypothetical protein
MYHHFNNQFFTNFSDTSYTTKCVITVGHYLQGTTNVLDELKDKKKHLVILEE